MVRESEIREGELAVEMPPARDAGLVFIGRIRTPWTSRLMTPRQGRHDGPVCRLEIFEPWVPALKGVDFYSNLEVIYWLHQSRRDLVLQSPKNNRIDPRHVFAALAGAAESDRHLDRQAGRHRGQRWCWCAASIASTRRRCWISSPTAANSRRWRRRRPGISRRSESCVIPARHSRSPNPTHDRVTIRACADRASRNDERDASRSTFSAAISFVALSSSTLPSSLRLAGGSSATPSWRGITCMCR